MTETRTVLLTGFEPFGGASTNPSGDVARALNGETLECTAAGAGEADTTDAAAHATVIGRVLPVSFAASAAQLEQLAAKHRPDLRLHHASHAVTVSQRPSSRTWSVKNTRSWVAVGAAVGRGSVCLR